MIISSLYGKCLNFGFYSFEIFRNTLVKNLHYIWNYSRNNKFHIRHDDDDNGNGVENLKNYVFVLYVCV